MRYVTPVTAGAVCLWLGLLLTPTRGLAQEGDGSHLVPIPLARVSGEITLDGLPSEAAWAGIDPVRMTMFQPVFRGEMTERTDVRFGYDDENLYISASMFDSEAASIRTNTFLRDASAGDDNFTVVVDSYNDFETAVTFSTNPAGARTDRTISNDAQFTGGGMPLNSDWNAHWDVATRTNAEGWFAEFRIPFSTLGFQMDGDEATMGIIVYRLIARKTERHIFPGISPEWGFFAYGKPSQAQRVTIQSVHPSKPIYVTPYVLGGMNQLPVLQEPPEFATPGWGTDNDPTAEIGGDLKYSPSSNLALDLTVNTDFAQVEADNQQINLTRFSLFFPEKRQFFQERASTFAFNTGGFTDRLFHSRQIGLFQGQVVPIYGGARVVGRIGGMDYGFLNMQTAPVAEDLLGTENMGVLRLNQRVFNDYSSLGGMVTTRMGSDGRNNVAYGLDTDIRVVGDEFFTVQWAQTFDEALEEESGIESALIRVRWERRKDEGFSYNAQYRRVGADYLPRLGFQLRDDFSSYGGELSYRWFMGAASPFRSVWISGQTAHLFRNEDGTVETRSIQPSMWFEFKSGMFIQLQETSSFESVENEFSIAGVPILPGEYWFHGLSTWVNLSRNSLFRGSIRGSAGSFYDGTRVGVSLNPTWTLSRYLELGGGYEINRFDYSDRGEQATTHLGRLRLQVALNTRVSLNAFGQYNSTTDQTSINARFRYHFREGTDLWIVYNEGYNLERENGTDPRLPLSAGRQVMLKYTHTFTW